MQSVRVLLILALPLILMGCNRASWGPSSGWETYNDPDLPDLELQDDNTTQGSYTPLQVSDSEDFD
jgi:hypothetical protein